MKICTWPAVLFITLLTGCASRMSGRPDRNLSLEPSETGALLKVAGLPIVQIDRKDIRFEMQLESTSRERATDVFDFECMGSACPPGFHISEEGKLVFRRDEGDSKTQKFKVNVKIGRANIPKERWSSNFVNVQIGDFNYMAGDRWQRTLNKAGEAPLGDFYKAVVGQRIRAESPAGSEAEISQLGTALYIGQYGGKKLVLTPYHVFASEINEGAIECNRDRIFSLDSEGEYLECSKILWMSEPYDLILLEVVDPQNHISLSDNVCLDSEGAFESGDHIAIIGFGTYRNLSGYKGTSSDSDCRVLTPSLNRIRSSADSMLYNHLFVSCDLSDGDSGGALVNIDKKQLLGIIVGGNRTNLENSSLAIQNFLAHPSDDPLKTANAIAITIHDFLEAFEASLAAGDPNQEIIKEIKEKNSNCSR